jgi:hypothetical protein
VAIAAPPALPGKAPAEVPRIARIDDCDVRGSENAILANVI